MQIKVPGLVLKHAAVQTGLVTVIVWLLNCTDSPLKNSYKE